MSAEINSRLEQSFQGTAVPPDVAYTLAKLSTQVVAADLTISGLRLSAGALAQLLKIAITFSKEGLPLDDKDFEGWEEMTSKAIEQAHTASDDFDRNMEEFKAQTAKFMAAREAVGLSNDTSAPWTDPPSLPISPSLRPDSRHPSTKKGKKK